MADANAEDQIHLSHQFRLVPHVMASFGVFSPLHESLDELAMDRLSMIDGIEGFLFRIGPWSEAMRVFHLRRTEKMLGKEYSDTLTSVYCLAYLLHQRTGTRMRKCSTIEHTLDIGRHSEEVPDYCSMLTVLFK